jgi:hypothetical protein
VRSADGHPLDGEYWEVDLGNGAEGVLMVDLTGFTWDGRRGLEGAAAGLGLEVGEITEATVDGAPALTAPLRGELERRSVEGYATAIRAGSTVVVALMVDAGDPEDMAAQFMVLVDSIDLP